MPKTSIIVPCHNQLPFTELCLQSVFDHSGNDWELVVVDNGSTDGTPAFLAGLACGARVPVKVITNTTDLGFPVAVNQGLRVADGDILVLLNNDAVVVHRWLDHLEGLLQLVGMAGPMSNYAPPPQLVEDIPYVDMVQMHRFAENWGIQHPATGLGVPKISGFCMAMRREVYETVGGMDEQFGLGYFEDDDYCERVRQAGYEIGIAQALFIHHFGSRTFGPDGTDVPKLLADNLVKFEAKHGPINGTFMQLTPFTATPRKVTVSLSMIVKDEECNLLRCIYPLVGIVDEIIVVDTGSTDRTKEIAANLGAKVFDFPWIDDFAAARNQSIEHATSDYVFWLDADDVIDPLQLDQLQQLFAGISDGTAYVFKCACNAGRAGGDGILVDQVRLFPRRDDVRWRYRVHEQIMLSLHDAKIPVCWTDIVINHFGYADPDVLERKRERNHAILLEELAARPDDPFVLFNLGVIATERRQWFRALPFLEKSLALSTPGNSIVPKLYALISQAYEMIGRHDQALALCDAGLLAGDDGELLFRKAALLRRSGRVSDAEECWHKILRTKFSNRFASVDIGIFGPLTLRNLAILAEEQGDATKARRLWQRVARLCPDDADVRAKLTDYQGAEE